MTEGAAPRKVNPIVKILVFAHLFMIASWSMPRPADAISNGIVKPRGEEWILHLNYEHIRKNDVLNNYLTWTGLWQGWDMFAPNPANVDIYLTSEVTYQDGSKKPGYFPRIKDLPIWEKYFKERYRKFYERANQDSNRWLWPAIAQRIAYENDTDRANPPVSVALTRHWREAKPLGQPTPEIYETYTYYNEKVDPTRLRFRR